MSTHILPNHLGLPPPLKLDLIDADRAVGWIAGQAVGFRGFANEVEAAHAAWVAYRTLSRRLARRYGTRPIPVDIEPVALQRHGEDEVILAGGRKIATLVRPGPYSPTGPDSFGFEIVIPQVADELRMRAKAYFIYRTLRKAGTRWALWESAAAAEPLPRSASPAVSGTDDADVARTVEGSVPDGIDAANHQRGGYSDVTQHSGQRPWWLRAVPWRRAGGLGRRASGRAPRV